MSESLGPVKAFQRDHPLFFRASVAALLILLIATTIVGIRVPRYRADAASFDRAMSDAERQTRDRILNSEARRSDLAVSLLQREIRLRSLGENEIHLAVDTQDSTLSLRHGPATLRETRITVGPDSAVYGPAGQSWRLVASLGERHVAEKQVNPTYIVPDWVYASRNEAVPADSERRIEGGLGQYVLRLDDGTEIHTRPQRGPLSEGARPAGFIVEDESDMRAIFDALSIDTPVYIY